MGATDRSLMTWEKSKARWRKMYKGKVYVVSCYQLGTPATSEASYRAANAWWRLKQAELAAAEAPPPHPHQAMLDHLDRRIAWARQHGLDRIADNAESGRYMVESSFDHSLDDVMPFLEMNTGDTDSWSKVIGDDIPEDKTLSGLCRRYLEQHELRRLAGDLSHGECYLIGHHTRGFVVWAGEGQAPEAITPAQWEGWWKHILKRVADKEISPAYALKYMKYPRRFISWLSGMGLMSVPANLHSKAHKFPTRTKALTTFSKEEVEKLVRAAPGQLKLHLLLMLNCGFTQADIASLLKTEIDLERGTITRQRSKTRQHHGGSVPTVTWTLWPVTLELLTKYISPHTTLALTTERGKPWVEEGIKADGKPTSRDAIQSNFRHIQKRLGQSKTLKAFRKTSASLLDNNNEYGRYAQHFLGHTPDTVAGRHYVTPSQSQFDAAVKWLGLEYGFVGP